MSDWLDDAGFGDGLDPEARRLLSGLRPVHVPVRSVLFSPGDKPRGFVLVLDGRIGVHLVGRMGRDMLLYTVGRGETCVQTTLGLMGDQAYSAEAVAETDLVAVIVPVALFETLMARSDAFRSFVFRAFAARVSDVMFLLEQVAFVRVEHRLAAALMERSDAAGLIEATHQELAVAIGSAREVVTRQLHVLASRGIVALERGIVRVLDRPGLRAIAEAES